VLDEPVRELGPVYEGMRFLQGAAESQLILKAAMCGRLDSLSGPRMAAAGIRPEPGRVILMRRAPLQEHAAIGMEYEDGECAMEEPAPMRFHLLQGSYFFIFGIDKNDVIHSMVQMNERQALRRIGRVQ
jgi:hypothetical protein